VGLLLREGRGREGRREREGREGWEAKRGGEEKVGEGGKGEGIEEGGKGPQKKFDKSSTGLEVNNNVHWTLTSL